MVEIGTPKQKNNSRKAKYYAGFSEEFVTDIFSYLKISRGDIVLDPWNGYGTTTTIAQRHGINSFGIDFNPISIIVSRSKIGCKSVDIKYLILSIKKVFKVIPLNILSDDDPLLVFYDKRTSRFIRSLTRALEIVFNQNLELHINKPEKIKLDFCLALRCLFEIIKKYSIDLRSSNPTWIKIPKEASLKQSLKLKPAIFNEFLTLFEDEINKNNKERRHNKPKIQLGRTDLGIAINKKANFVITSPPYLTRIDYVVSTYLELSILGLPLEKIQELRKKATGTSKIVDVEAVRIPKYCEKLLNKITNHSSYSSNGYYKKFFHQYFVHLKTSFSSIDKNVVRSAQLVFVVQETFYKSLKINMDKIIISYANELGWCLSYKKKFLAKNNMINVNKSSGKYRKDNRSFEFVLIFKKGT